jgi:hypothetical protein
MARQFNSIAPAGNDERRPLGDVPLKVYPRWPVAALRANIQLILLSLPLRDSLMLPHCIPHRIALMLPCVPLLRCSHPSLPPHPIPHKWKSPAAAFTDMHPFHCLPPQPSGLQVPEPLPLHPPRRLLCRAAHHHSAQAAARVLGVPVPRAHPRRLPLRLAQPLHGHLQVRVGWVGGWGLVGCVCWRWRRVLSLPLRGVNECLMKRSCPCPCPLKRTPAMHHKFLLLQSGDSRVGVS